MTPPKFLHLFFIIFSLQLFHLTVSFQYDRRTVEVHPFDKKVLLYIQRHFGNNSKILTPFNFSDCCSYSCDEDEPLECDGFTGHVAKLSLQTSRASPSFSGRIPSFVKDLPSLYGLHLSGPFFMGPIPRFIGKMTNLNSLHIVNTSMTGPIPSFVGRLHNLYVLVLLNNKFTGPIPKALSKLKGLGTLDLSSNNFYGPIPDFLGRLSDIRIISLKSNRFSGPIPASLGPIMYLYTLDLSRNRLTGSIPDNIFSVESFIIDLFLNNNQFSGSIPEAMARSSIQKLDVSSNKLTNASELFQRGDFHAYDINLSNNLLRFDFSRARFSDHIRSLNISHNMIYGSLPLRLTKLKQLSSLDLSYNKLCGPIRVSSRLLEQSNSTNFAHNKCLCGAPLDPCS